MSDRTFTTVDTPDTGRSAPAALTVRCPADGRIVGQVPNQTPEEVAEIVRTLRAHQVVWETLGIDGRERWLRRWRDWLLDNDKRITRLMQEETGKPWAEAMLEVPIGADIINYYTGNAKKFLADERPRPHNPLTAVKRLTTVYRPYPVVGVIAPWNFPLVIPFWDAIPALVAGAAVVIKPASATPLALREVIRGWEEIGAPPVLACATGSGGTGTAVVDAVDYIQFTGSTATGKAIAQRAAAQLKPYGLELGGKDAAIVLADADLSRAANGIAWGGLANAGQMCVSVERVYVEAGVYDAFVERLVERVGSLRQGADDDSFSADVGPLANDDQLQIVERHVSEALAKGARALTGGKPTGIGTFFEPTVLVDVDHTMACIREETFGPTIPVMKVADAEEAIALANDSEYGLSATVWTRNHKRGEEIARRLEAGAVNINDSAANAFCNPLPMGGWKESGVGARLGGAYAVRKYCRAQAITTPRLPIVPRTELLWYPYSALKGQLVARVLRVLVAGDVRRRLGI